MPSLEISTAGRATPCITLRRTIRRLPSPKYAGVYRYRPSPRTTLIGRMVATKTVVHVADLAAEQAYIERRVPQSLQPSNLGVYGRFWLSQC